MIEHRPTDFGTFGRQVVALLEMKRLLTFAFPHLQNFFRQQLQAPVNLRLGFYQHFLSQKTLAQQFIFPPEGRAQDFPTGTPDWYDDKLSLDTPSLCAKAFLHRQAAYLTADRLVTLLPADTSVRLSRLAYPLATDGDTNPVAILEIELREPVEVSLSAGLREALELFGVALANARRFEETRHSLDRMESLAANREELFWQPDLRLTLEMTVRRAMTLLEADGGTFYLADYEHHEVECYIDLNSTRNFTGIRLNFGEGVAGSVIHTGQAVIVDNYAEWDGRAEALGDNPGFVAILGVPVIWENEVIGIISLMNYVPGHVFHPKDAELLSHFAEQAAAAIFFSRTLEATRRSKRELELLNQTAALVNSNLDLTAICEVMVNELADKFGYRCVFIYLREEDGQIHFKAQRGYDQYMLTLDEHTGVCGRAIRTRQPQLVRNASLDPDYFFNMPTTGGVYMPILHQADLLGIMGVEVIESRVGEADLRLLETLSAHLSVAIRNAQLFKEIDRQSTQLQRRNQELETVFSGLNEGLLISHKVADHEWELQANPEGMRLLGWGEHIPNNAELGSEANYELHLPVPGARSFYDRAEVPPAARPLRFEEWPVARAIRGERFSNFELLVKGPDGQRRVLSFAGAPMHNAEGEVVQALVVFHDVTALRAVEQMRDSFLSLVSHDLRTPLAAISGYAEQALYSLETLDNKAQEMARRSLQVILRHSDRLNRLVGDLLDMARLESGRLRLDLHPYNLAPLIRNACFYIIETMPSQIGWAPDPQRPDNPYFRLELDRNLPKVLLDQERFDQVLSNLLSNAVKYSNQGGEILITLAPDQFEPGFARLSIRDQGIGIEPEKLSRLFNQFYRTEQAEQGGFGGTGLGLYICRLMVEAHNGRIQVESDGPNRGTTFHVMMPFAT